MTQRAARLAIVLMLALPLRAGGQQYNFQFSERGDPYAPQGAATQPSGAVAAPSSVPVDPARYPLPQYDRAQALPPQVAQPGSAMAAIPQPPIPRPSIPPPGQPAAAPVQQAAAQQPPAGPPPADLFEPAQIVARVGDKFIFYGDVAPMVNQILEPMLARAKNDYERQEIEKLRPMLAKNVTRQLVEYKLFYLEFEREMIKNVGTDPKDLAEVRQKTDTQVREMFESELSRYRELVRKTKPEDMKSLIQSDPIIVRLASMMEERKLETLQELDAVLRGYGSSLERQIRAYGEHKLGLQIVFKSVKKKHEVTHQEMIDYYESHAADYAVPAKARFEILTVKFANFRDRNEAWNAISAMGNEVYFGTPFAAVARKSSQEPQAAQGGAYDWTTQGSLASQAIDHAIFTLEPGKLSQIIEDERGFHIVRVTERQEAGQVSFLEAQPAISKAIKESKRQADIRKFMTSLAERTKVSTIYDEPAAVAEQPGPALR